MTSIDWLAEKYPISINDYELAKEMHKLEIIKCYNTSFMESQDHNKTAWKYYEKKFNNKKNKNK